MHAETEALRHAAEAEAEATLRAARAEAQSATLEAHATRTRADAEAAEILAEARSHRAAGDRPADRRGPPRSSPNSPRGSASWTTPSPTGAEERRVAAEAAELDARWPSSTPGSASSTAQADLDQRGAELDDAAAELERRIGEFDRELERVAGLTAEQAKAELMAGVEANARRDAAVLVRTIENDARAEGTERARAIVAEAVQRVASEQTSETVVSVMHLPSDEMKGRIIGREGRNIRAYETVTGVNLIIDDTPEAVLLSCFDPVRREVGRLTLERAGARRPDPPAPHRGGLRAEQGRGRRACACARPGTRSPTSASPTWTIALLPTLGRLKYRTSYGQNVLGHLIETAHIAGVMAAELGIEPTLVKRCAFLHDIGKALTHEVEGSHAIIGAELLRKYGEDEAVAHAVEAHHNEVQPRTIEAVLTQASRHVFGGPARRPPRIARVLRQAAGPHRGDRHRHAPASRRCSRCSPAARSG